MKETFLDCKPIIPHFERSVKSFLKYFAIVFVKEGQRGCDVLQLHMWNNRRS